MEGATGLDTEFVIAGEPFPAIIFGYVRPTNAVAGTGQDQRCRRGIQGLRPRQGWRPELRAHASEPSSTSPIDRPWIALSDLQAGDTAVWVGQGNSNGTFTIPNVPPGTYTLTWWDEPQNYILNLMNVTVGNGESVDLGVLPLNGWWTRIEGYVFNDINRNGVKDEGEPGLAGYTLTFRKRENSLMDRGATAVTTDANGYYVADNAYPITQWVILEAYDELHYTTGVTFQADNQPEATTHIGAGVDVSVLPIIGLGGRIDWGKHAYDATGAGGVDPRNGGIVGTVTYDTTRNELDPRYAAAEDWQPGISGLTMKLYAPVFCGTNAELRATPRAVRRSLRDLPLTARSPRGPPQHVCHRVLAAARQGCRHSRQVRAPRRRRQPAGVPRRPASDGFRRGLPRRPADGRAVRHVRDRPGNGRRQLRRRRRRQLRVRRWLLRHRMGSTRPPMHAPIVHRPGTFNAARRARLPGRGRDPQRRAGSPAVQRNQGRGHQHRQRRRIRPAAVPPAACVGPLHRCT